MTFSRRHFRKLRSASTRAARRRSGALSLAMARRVATATSLLEKRPVQNAAWWRPGKVVVRSTIGIVRRIGDAIRVTHALGAKKCDEFSVSQWALPAVEPIDQYTKHLLGSVGVEFGELLVTKIKIAREAIAPVHRDLESGTHDVPENHWRIACSTPRFRASSNASATVRIRRQVQRHD